MKKNNFQMLKGWIASYTEIGEFLLRKEHLQGLVRAYACGDDIRNLMTLIERKELQLMGRPVFDDNGVLLDKHFMPARFTYFNAMIQVNKIREQGYWVKLSGRGHIQIELLHEELLTA